MNREPPTEPHPRRRHDPGLIHHFLMSVLRATGRWNAMRRSPVPATGALVLQEERP